jgi:hypothetical protein
MALHKIHPPMDKRRQFDRVKKTYSLEQSGIAFFESLLYRIHLRQPVLRRFLRFLQTEQAGNGGHSFPECVVSAAQAFRGFRKIAGTRYAPGKCGQPRPRHGKAGAGLDRPSFYSGVDK